MTTLVANLSRGRQRLRLGEMAERITGILLILGVLFWMGANLVKAPSDFFQNMVTGINRGALYALIALGYTLVYGIIELINFAHGDLFMLATVLAANMMVNWLGLEQTNASGFFGLALTMLVCMVFAAGVNVGAEFFAYR
ncbi:MAG TPA: hypothetical protein VFL67_15530, partial [Mycobacterium sp.]|nr:hypothetical protein [Mycobacterium sp.]